MAGGDRQHVLHRLEFGDRAAELHALIGVGQCVVHAALHAADHLLHTDRGAERHQAGLRQPGRRRENVLARQFDIVEAKLIAGLIRDVAPPRVQVRR